MIKQTFIGGLLVAAVVLAGCERRPSNPDLPKTETTAAMPDAPVAPDRTRAEMSAPRPAAPVADASLPSATAALNSVDGKPQTPPTAVIENTPMSKATESAAMPLGGQNNDHSAPKAGDAASAASR